MQLPEVDAKDMDIQVEANQLTVRGERKPEKAEDRDGYHRIERTYGAFSRSFTPSAAGWQTPTAVCQGGKLGWGGGRKTTELGLSVLPPRVMDHFTTDLLNRDGWVLSL